MFLAVITDRVIAVIRQHILPRATTSMPSGSSRSSLGIIAHGRRDLLLRRLAPVVPGGDVLESRPQDLAHLEASGLAAAGRTPFDTIVPALVDEWVRWAADHIDGTPAQRRTEAEAAIALIDGLLLFRQLAGAQRADRAARHLGIR